MPFRVHAEKTNEGLAGTKLIFFQDLSFLIGSDFNTALYNWDCLSCFMGTDISYSNLINNLFHVIYKLEIEKDRAFELKVVDNLMRF